MSPRRRSWAISLLLLAVGERALCGQQPVPEDRPAAAPSKPLTRKERDQQEARKLYGIALLQQRQDRLLEAVRTLEQARALDPGAGPVHKGLMTLYLALGRDKDALAACEKALAADASDHEAWYIYSRQLRELGRSKEAVTALTRALACPRVKELPHLILRMNVELGGLYESLKDYAQAEAAFRKVVAVLENPDALVQSGGFSRVQLYGDAASTYVRIGQVCIATKKYDQAVEALRKAQAILSDDNKGKNPSRADQLNRDLAEVCLAQKQPKIALEYLDQYLQKQPMEAEAYELRIKILKELGQEEEIVPSLRRYAARDRYNIALQLLLAREYGRHDQHADAERIYLEVAKQKPSQEVYRGLFSLYIQDMRKPERALNLLNGAMRQASNRNEGMPPQLLAMFGALRRDTEIVQALIAEGDDESQAGNLREAATWLFLADLARRTGQLPVAERLYKRCLARSTPLTEGEAYYGLLPVLMQAKKYDEAVKVCQEGLRNSQANLSAVFQSHLAHALFELGRTDEALAASEEAVKLSDDGNRLGRRRFRVILLTEAGRFDQAIAECQKMLKEYSLPGDIRLVRISLSNAYSTARDFPKAVDQLRLVLEENPNDALACNNLGYLLADQGKDLEEAEKLIRKAIELDTAERKQAEKLIREAIEDAAERKKSDAAERKKKVVSAESVGDEPENAAYLDSLGWVLFRRGQPKEARIWLEKAAALPSGADDPTVWDHLGDVYFRLEDTARARTAWEKSLKLYETERRRHSEERMKEVKHKLQLLETETQRK